MKQVSFFQWIGNHAKGAFPRAMQQIECTFDPTPMWQMKESVGNGF